MKTSLLLCFIIFSQLGFSQLDKKDFINTWWFSDNSDSLFYKSDTIYLTKYVFEEERSIDRTHYLKTYPKIFIQRKRLKLIKTDWSDDNGTLDYLDFTFQKGKRINLGEDRDGGYIGIAYPDYYWRWNFNENEKTTLIYDKSTNEEIWTFEILDLSSTNANKSYSTETRETITLKIKKR